MKISVAIALITCGTILVLSPQVYSIIQTAFVAETMQEVSQKVSFSTGVTKDYQLVCVICGIIMIGAGTIAPVLMKNGLEIKAEVESAMNR